MRNKFNSIDHLYVQVADGIQNMIAEEILKIGDELDGFKTSFALANDDSQTDMLIYGNGALYAYDLFTGKLFEYFNELAVYDDAQLVHTSEHNWIIAYDKTGQKIDVINTDGKLALSLPNVTQKPFACNLYNNGKMYVLLINGNKVSCQELK